MVTQISPALKEFMSSDVLSVPPQASLAQIADLMKSHRYSCLPVVDNDKPIGIITERDMLHQLSRLLSTVESKLPVAADFMSDRLITLSLESTLFDALVVCYANKIRHLPVVDANQRLQGMVTYTDITNLYRALLQNQPIRDGQSAAERINQLEAANRKLQELSMEDPLLGIGNRRAMEVDLRATHEVSLRYEDPYAVAMIDIDNFKFYNDYYGHQQGDKALKQVADTVHQAIRVSDRLYRYGGEELLILLPQTDVVGAKQTAERILSALKEKQIPNCKSPFRVITVSCGVSQFVGKKLSPKPEYPQVVARADIALYRAKNNGRNNVVVDAAMFI